MYYTIIITICKVGAIWSKKIVTKKIFNTVGSIVIMLMIIEVINKRNKVKEIYERKKNREVHAESRIRDSKAN